MTNNTALPAVRRCARRLENQGMPIEDVADALFTEAAGRLAATTNMTKAIFDLAVLWTAIGRAAQIKRGADGNG